MRKAQVFPDPVSATPIMSLYGRTVKEALDVALGNDLKDLKRYSKDEGDNVRGEARIQEDKF